MLYSSRPYLLFESLAVVLATNTTIDSASIVTFCWEKGVSTPHPNFHCGHVCADYGSSLKWGKGRKADMLKVEGWDDHVNLKDDDVEINHLPRWK